MTDSIEVKTDGGLPNGQLISIGEFAAKNVMAVVPELQKIPGVEEKIRAAMKNEIDMVSTHMALVVGDLQAQAESELIKIRTGFRWAQQYPGTAAGVALTLVTIGVLIGHFVR